MTRIYAPFLALALATGCAAADLDGGGDDEAPVSDLDALLGGVPDNGSLPDENKEDAVYPRLHADLLAVQSPVKSQGSRGVCSIFATLGLMEHLYLKEGTIPDPDFSEQWLQWSVKFELNAFPTSSGSNANYNLRSISQYGVVEEAVWPYESSPWGAAQDPACGVEEAQRPLRCHTNGEPTDAMKAAPRFKLPAGRWLNTNSIKAHITSKGTGVVVGMEFFYQAWNHRRSELPTDREAWKKGIVRYPNDKDKEVSAKSPAGHAILIVGWDDDLEVQEIDDKGQPVVDGDGKPVMDKGFWIFKNSWGTGNFGIDNPHGDGYGYLSMKYVDEYANAYVSDLPVVDRPREQCGNGIDDDSNGKTDCDDTACATAPACQPDTTERTYTAQPNAAIPDNDPVGVASVITVADAGSVRELEVTLDISHPYQGDLQVVLHHAGKSAVLHDRTGGYQDDLKLTLTPADFDGGALDGDWRLVVTDTAAYDTGTLNSWQITVSTD